MSGRPRKGQVASFNADDGILEVHKPSSVTGLRFSVEARSGGTAQLDFTDLKPRALAIEMAQAIRRLSEVGGKSRVHAFTRLSKIVVVFREIDADDPARVSGSLRSRLRYTSARPFERPQPRDAYSPYVARQLRDAARADVAAVLRRVDGQLPEALATCNNSIVQERAAALHKAVIKRGFLPRNDKATRNLYQALYSRGLPTSSLLDDIYSRFYLSVHDLPPLLTLLSLDTGLEIECVKALKADCLSSASADTVTLHYTKRRAHGLAQKTMRLRDTGPTTPGGLIRAIVAMTESARRFCPSDALFVFYHACSFHDVVRHPNSTLRHWITRHSIVDDQGQPLKLLLSRLRKTHKALWYLKAGGHMARFAVGHLVEIAARHYADIPSLRPLHEATVMNALEDAIRPGAEKATGVVQDVGDTCVDTQHNIPLKEDNHFEPTDVQDVWLASCSCFYDSPFSKPGTPCSFAFWGCLDCRNAVITERKLPAILGFLNFILAQRALLEAEDWAAKFGHAHERITRQILPAFSEEVIASAREALAAEPPMTYLPPEVR